MVRDAETEAEAAAAQVVAAPGPPATPDDEEEELNELELLRERVLPS